MEVIDLTYLIEEGMTTFSSHWHPIVEITHLGRHGFEGRETKKVVLGTHTGTHMDAPLHFIENGKSIDDIPLSRLIGAVTILDFSHLEENQAITKDMLMKVDLSERIILKYGWQKKWGTARYYMDYPFISEEAAHYLVEQNVKLIAMDTPSPDDSRIKLDKASLGSEADSPVHKILLGNDVYLVEYLANLDQVENTKDWNISVMPIKIKNADGAPARVCVFK